MTGTNRRTENNPRDKTPLKVREIPVDKIRPEEGLGRRRDREGHAELRRSIEQFGVLTPITVRPAPGNSGEYLLIKGQGRTLACRMMGIRTIPALVVEPNQADDEKVRQFLVENVARLKMTPVDRALLIARARRQGEETASVAARFGVTSSTVRRLEAQLYGASSGEVAALRSGALSLTYHAVLAKHMSAAERTEAINRLSPPGLPAKEMDALLIALNYRGLTNLGPDHRPQRIQLLVWATNAMSSMPPSDPRDRIRQLSLKMPTEIPVDNGAEAVA